MTRYLATVWRREWTALVAAHEDLLHLSSEVGEVHGKPQYLPTKVVQLRVFPSVFAEALSQPDANWLREWPVDNPRDVNSDEEARLVAAIGSAAPWLARIGALVPRIDPHISARELRVSSKRDGVLALCLPVTRSRKKPLSDAEIQELLETYKIASSDVSPTRLREALRDRDVVAAAEARLRELTTLTSRSSSLTEGLDMSERLLREFLDVPGLSALAAPAARAAGRSDAAVDAAWEAAQRSGVDLWHRRAKTIRLSAHEVPPVPQVTSTRKLPGFQPVLWLDTSISDRLAPALKFDLTLRTGLPPLQDFIDAEFERATSPLGVSEVVSRTIVALGGIIQGEYFDQHELEERRQNETRGGFVPASDRRTAATLALMKSVHGWRERKKAFESNAAFPGQAVVNIIDLPGWYMSGLWRRIHTHEVQGGSLRTPGEVWWLLTQLGKSTAQNIRAKKWGTEGAAAEEALEPPTGQPVAEAVVLETDEDEELTVSDRARLVNAVNTALVALAEHGVGNEQLGPFLHSDAWGAEAHRDTWAQWCADAGVTLTYEHLRRWWDDNRYG